MPNQSGAESDEDADIKRLTAELDAELALASDATSTLEATESQSSKDPVDDETTPESANFVQLSEFIKKDQLRKAKINNPENTATIAKLEKYHFVKGNDFETMQKQKGLQLNRAA